MTSLKLFFTRSVVLLLLGLAAGGALAAASPHVSPPDEALRISSPDGRLDVFVYVSPLGNVVYQAQFRGEPVVHESRLGLRFRSHPGFDSGLELAELGRRDHDEHWEQPWGERRLVRDRHRELLVRLRAMQPEREILVRFRVFDDGFGFRYEMPAQAGFEKLEIVEELTEFHLPERADSWWIPGRRYNRYEYLYRSTDISQVEMAHTPMTLRLPSGVHLSLHEAALVDYAGYVLDQRRENVFQTNLTPWSDGVRVRTGAPFHTPWRTVQVAPDAIGLLNSDLVLNLNEPNALGDVSWVEPGKYLGIWWSLHIGQETWGSGPRHGATSDNTRRYMDFAAEHGFSGVLVEGWNIGWDGDWFHNGDLFDFTRSYPDFDLGEVSAWGAERDVRLIGHHETSGNVSNYERQLDAALDLYERHGVRQVKTGYVADAGDIKRVDDNGLEHFEWHDGQFMVNHYNALLPAAARRKISINTHEPIKDTGLRRTYPNWLSREGARGQEFNAWGKPTNTPEHTAILPFTRMLAGPMDFTPGIFNLTFDGPDSAQRVPTTLAKQLALYVVLYSPVQMAADLPEHYQQRMDAFQFIKDVPTDWEQSIALAGEVGEYVVFARKRRGGDDWFIGALTNEQARTVRLELDFLDQPGPWLAQVYRDGDDAHWWSNPHAMHIEQIDIEPGQSLSLPLAAGGGAAVRLLPAGPRQP